MIANVEKCLPECITSDNVDGFDAPSRQCAPEIWY